MCPLVSYLAFSAVFSLLSQMGYHYRVTAKGITWKRKGETAEVWMGKERAVIFEYFEKLEKSMDGGAL